MTGVFIAGAHTDVGKTHVACALIAAARRAGRSVEALKPVVSGFEMADWSASDPGRLLAALGRPSSAAQLEAISPWRFAAPLAPPMAARREGRALSLDEIVVFCRGRLAACAADLCLVEGVGGVMSPVADDGTVLELMTALGLPVVIVGGSYLGAISHTLTALETVRGRGLRVSAVVVSQCADSEAPDFDETVADTRRYGGERMTLAAPRDARGQTYAKALLADLVGIEALEGMSEVSSIPPDQRPAVASDARRR